MRTFFAKILINYLRFFARLKLKRTNPKIIGVSGASGKSSLVNLIYLSTKNNLRVKQTTGKNSETGLPLSILNLDPKNYSYSDWLRIALLAPKMALTRDRVELFIAEMGIDGPKEPKNMTYLLKILVPDIGVITNLSFEHSQYFDSEVNEENDAKRREKILEMTSNEEMKLLFSLPQNALSIINLDDKILRRNLNKIKSNKITVSREDEEADYFIEKVEVTIDSFKLVFQYKERKYEIKLPFPLPAHFAYSLVMAIAVSERLEIDIRTTIKNLEHNFSLPPGRLSIFKGIKESIIIDSSYNNATITPIIDILDMVSEISGNRKKIGVIGDMRELGSVKKFLHEKLAQKISKSLDFVILIGPLTKEYVSPILKSQNVNHKSFNTYSEARNEIIKSVGKGDVVLVKGSQNTLFLERVVEDLLENKKDRENLPRRGQYWEEIRSKAS